MLAFIAKQIACEPSDLGVYAQRGETRREHLGELQAYLDVRSFRRDDKRPLALIAIEQATGSDRGDIIVSAMIEYLRERRVLLPAAVTLEKIALAGRALARKRAYRTLIEGLPPQTIAGLEALVVVAEDKERTPLAWLREWPEAPRQKNLLAVVERLEAVRELGVGPDRERRIHRARYAAIARETAIVSAQHLARFDAPRRLATLVVFVREMEAVLTDVALAMFGKMLGAVFRRADRTHKENLVDRAKAIDASARALLGMAKAMLAAKEKGEPDRRRRTCARLGATEDPGRRDRIGRRRFATRQSRRGRRAIRERAAHVASHPRRVRLPILEGARSTARGARRGARASHGPRQETSGAFADEFPASGLAQGRQGRRRKRSPCL